MALNAESAETGTLIISSDEDWFWSKKASLAKHGQKQFTRNARRRDTATQKTACAFCTYAITSCWGQKETSVVLFSLQKVTP